MASSRLSTPLPLSRYELCSRLMVDDPLVHRGQAALTRAMRRVQEGEYILKFGRSGKPHKRFVSVNADADGIAWLSHRKKIADSTSE